MTLSEEDLENVRMCISNANIYNYISPILRCSDITWDRSKKCLSILGEIFAICDCEINPSKRITIAETFRRNGGITLVDEMGHRLKIKGHHGMYIGHGNYHHIHGLFRWSDSRPRKRSVGEIIGKNHRYASVACNRTMMIIS